MRKGIASVFSYDGRRFRPAPDNAGQDDAGQDDAGVPVARYHQDGDTVWAEFAGGSVRKGSIAGTSDADGALHFGYCMVLADGALIVGCCDSRPSLLADGRLMLTERWQRYGQDPAAGISYLHEVRAPL
jgi:hypothetical protein